MTRTPALAYGPPMRLAALDDRGVRLQPGLRWLRRSK
jgi:hypothetical protein